MTSPILFVGGEDIDFIQLNGAVWSVSTAANSFRGGYARCSMVMSVGSSTLDTTHYLSAPFAATGTFWTTFRMNYGTAGGGGSAFNQAFIPLKFYDANGVERIRIRLTQGFAQPNDTFNVYKVDAAGTLTQLGSTSTGRYNSSTLANTSVVLATPDKIDVFMNYGTSGQIQVFLNGTKTYDSGTVDTTTNGNAALAFVGLGINSSANAGGTTFIYYSEAIVSTHDTRSLNLVTQTATAVGNTHNFDGGTAANISALTAATGDASPNFSNTAGQINEYQVTPTLPVGTFGVVSVIHKIRAVAGESGPQKIDDMVRTGGTDYVSSDIPLVGSWQTYASPWDLNPNTGLAWAVGELASASTTFNMGAKSVT